MVTSGVLTKTIATATGLGSTVALVVRQLREHGLLTTGARGVNAPPMTPLDAARVLIALLVTDSPLDAVKAVESFGSLVRVNFPPREYQGLHGIDDTIDGGKTATFEGALAAVIRWLSWRPRDSGETKVGVSVTINDLAAQIDLPWMRYQYAHKLLQVGANEGTHIETPFFDLRAAYRQSKIRIRREFTEEVLLPVVEDFREEGE
jgi:hypothetical protein